MRQVEAVILALVATIGGCFLIQIFLARPDWGGVATGLGRRLPDGAAVRGDRHPGRHGDAAQPVLALGARADAADRDRTGESKAAACRYYLIDSAIALNAGVLRQRGDPGRQRGGVQTPWHRGGQHREGLQALCPTFLGGTAPILFGIALLCAGQSSTLTGTLAGQIVMEGYLHLRMAPVAPSAGDAAAGPGAGGRGDLAGRRQGDAGAPGPQPGDPQPAALVRGDPADPLHVEPAEHGRVRDALVGPDPGLDGRGDHRRTQCHAGRDEDPRMDRPGGRVGAAGRADPAPVDRRRRAVSPWRAGRRSCWPSWRSSRWRDGRRCGCPSRASSSTGRRRSGPGRWVGSAWRSSTTRPTPRSSTGAWAWR